MSDANRLDPSKARSDFQRCVIILRNDGTSWPKIARALGSTVSIVRASWGRANYNQRGGHVKPTTSTTREDPTIGNEEQLRGLPMFPPNGGIPGAIRGTRPGDPAWMLERDQRPRRRRMAS